MDYLTRRAVAQQHGVRGVLLGGDDSFPRIAALGVRVNRDGAVTNKEIRQACTDIMIEVQLPEASVLDAGTIERALSGYDPVDLKRRIESFLDQLAYGARANHENRNP